MVQNLEKPIDEALKNELNKIDANSVIFSKEALWENLSDDEKNEYLNLNERYLNLLDKTKELNSRITKLFNINPYKAYEEWKFHCWVCQDGGILVLESGEPPYQVIWFQWLYMKNHYISSEHNGRVLSNPNSEDRPVLEILWWEKQWNYNLSVEEFNMVLDKIEWAIKREEDELKELEWKRNSWVIGWLK